MAGLIFHYSPARTLLHRLDARVKMLLLMLVSSALFFVYGRGLCLLAFAVLILLPAARISLFRIFRAALPLWILTAALFVSRALLTPGTAAGASAWWRFFPVSREGLLIGAEDSGRLIILILLCHVFTAATPVSSIQRAAAFFAGKNAALLVRLAFAMIPELIDTALEILAALSCRGLSFARRPVYALTVFGTVFARKASRRAALMADALEARCCTPERGGKPFAPGFRDAAALALGAAVLAAALLVGRQPSVL